MLGLIESIKNGVIGTIRGSGEIVTAITETVSGSLVAAFTATRISARFGIGPTSIVMAALFGPAFLLVAFAPEGNSAIPYLVAAFLVFGFSVVVYNIAQVSYRQAICPPRLQGRMNSVMRFMVWGTIPIGTLLGGALATWIGLRDHRRSRRFSVALRRRFRPVRPRKRRLRANQN